MPPRVHALQRHADRWLGPPILAALRLRRRRRAEPPTSPRHVALLRTACMGDTILASALVADLRLALPHARVTLLVGPDNAATARLLQPDDLIILPLHHPLHAIRHMQALTPDLLVDLGAWPRIDALLAAASPTAFTVGFRTPHQHRHAAYDRAVDHRRDRHELDNLRALLHALDLPTGQPPTLHVPPGNTLQLPPRTVLFHPFSAGRRAADKHWPADHWAGLARLLHLQGRPLAITGSAADHAAAAELCAACHHACPTPADTPSSVRPPLLNLAGAADLPTLARTLADIKQTAALVSVNTGIAHLAAALKTPTLSLDGSAPAGRWGPLGPRVISVPPVPPAAAYLHLGFEKRMPSAPDPMASIMPQTVFDALQTLTS